MDLLSRLIKDHRARKALTQEELGERVGVTRVTIQQLESGAEKKAGSIQLLVALQQELAPDSPLSLWTLAHLERTLSRHEEFNDANHAGLWSDLNRAAELLTPRGSTLNPPPKSLIGFPVGFEPFTVVVGDRREDPPVTRGDLMAGSASPEDLRHILSVGLTDSHSVIQTDKVIVNTMNEDDLRRIFGRTNLLVVGSPFVNFMSRVINQWSQFKFKPVRAIRTWQDNLEGIRNIQGFELKTFGELSQGSKKRLRPTNADGEDRHLDELANRLSLGKPTRSLKELYRPIGLVDPVEMDTYGCNRGSDTSYGIISLTHNPYSESKEYFAVTVAGVHRPSTMMALKALAEGDFSKHPLGGVIEVVQPPGQAEESWWSWKTPRYTVADLANNLESALDSDPNVRPRVFKDWTSDEIECCLEFCRRVS